jgi:NTP pyrophosphatase (non-canonical NTP hydrolase)
MKDVEPLIAELRQFVAERDWAQFHDPKNLAMLLASEVGELVAEYRWVASDAADAHALDGEARARISDEIGDVGIRAAVAVRSDGDRPRPGDRREDREEPRPLSG